MRTEYIQYLRDLNLKQVDELLDLYFEDQISVVEFDSQITQWAINERGFIKGQKIERLLEDKDTTQLDPTQE